MAAPASPDCKSNETTNKSFRNEFNFDERNEEYTNGTKQKYFDQCESLKDNENQQNLLVLLSYERYNNYPLASYLIDSYLIDKFEFYLKQKENEIKIESQSDMNIIKWGKGQCNHHILTNLIKSHQNNETIRDNIIGGLTIYFRRYIRPMSFPCTTYLINDKIERFVQCLVEANRLINKILKDVIQIPPFQVL